MNKSIDSVRDLPTKREKKKPRIDAVHEIHPSQNHVHPVLQNHPKARETPPTPAPLGYNTLRMSNGMYPISKVKGD